MAPLAQWAIQILSGSLYAKDYVSSCGTQWQVTPQAKDYPATSPVGSIGLTATSPGVNRIDVYAGPFDDGSIGHKYSIRNWWNPTNGYDNLGGSIKGPPLALSWSPNKNDIFAVGRDDRLWHKAIRQDGTWDPSLYEWRDLGGNLSSNYRLTAAGSESRVDVFGVREENGGTKSLWRQSWNGSSWLPVLELLKGSYSTAPSVTSRAPGELSLFIAPDFAIGPDRLDVFGIKDDGALYLRAWVLTKEHWLKWENFGDTFDEIVSVEKFTEESLVLVGRKSDGSYEGRFYGWNRPANESVWDSFGGAFASQPALVSPSQYVIHTFGIGLDGALLRQFFNGIGEWSYPGRREWQTVAEGPEAVRETRG